MKVSTTKLENCQAVLNVEAEPSELEKAMGEAYRQIVKRTAVPGFRPGKAPRQVLERHVGRAALEREAYSKFIPEAYEKALKEAGLEVIAEPDVEITKSEPLTFKATVSLRPIVELGDYTKIQVTVEPTPVTEEDTAKALEQLRREQALWEPVERPVELGDLVTLNVQSEEAGKVFLNEDGLQYEVVSGSPFPLSGFSEQLVGMEKNQEKKFQLVAPTDHPNQALRGKTLDFQVQILEIKSKELSPLDDSFATTMNFHNLEALREWVVGRLKNRAGEEAKRKLEETALSAVLDISHLEFPPVLVEQEIGRLLQRSAASRPRGAPQPEPEVVEQLRPIATENIRRSLALGKLAEVEKIEVSPEEVEAEVERLAKGGGGNKAEEIRKFFAAPAAQRSLKESLTAKKTLERLVAIATGKAIEDKTENNIDKTSV